MSMAEQGRPPAITSDAADSPGSPQRFIAVTGFPKAARILDPIAAALEGEGHRVARWFDSAALLARPDWRDAEIVVSVGVACGAAEMDAAPHLRGIVSPVIGFDWIDVDAASERGIPVVNAPVRETEESMAEATIMLVLVALYDLHATERSLRLEKVEREPSRRMLSGRTLGIIGFGKIAKAVVHRLAGWGVDIQAYSSSTLDFPGVRFTGLDPLLATSDVVLVLSSLHKGSRNLLDGVRLAAMKPGSILVNTARGGIVDEDALVQALSSGRIAKAMLDVFAVEPLPMDSPLRTLENVVLTPHAIGHTMEMGVAIPALGIRNVLGLLAGNMPASCVNLAGLESPRQRE